MFTVERRDAILAFILVVIALSVLTGCKTKPTLREIPIPVACIKTLPTELRIEFDALPEGSTFSDEVRALLIDHAAMKSSLEEARALMIPCLIP